MHSRYMGKVACMFSEPLATLFITCDGQAQCLRAVMKGGPAVTHYSLLRHTEDCNSAIVCALMLQHFQGDRATYKPMQLCERLLQHI